MTLSDGGSSRQTGATSVEPDATRTPTAESTRIGSATRGDDVARRAVTADQRLDRMRWGPVWAGLLVTLLTFAVLELGFFALGWLTFGQDQPGSTAGWVSGLLGVAAFFVGGITAGVTVMWRDVTSGVLHGMLVWALTTVGIILFTLLGGGALFGAVADVFAQVASLQDPNLSDVRGEEIAGAARSAAGWALLALLLSFVAAVLGGALGVKLWPRKRDADRAQ